jgi:hypothetical protein
MPYGHYNPYDWYWATDDGVRVYSSKSQTIVPATDAGFQAWCNVQGGVPKNWPKDTGGAQTTQSLQDVLTPYNLFVDLKAYGAYKRWKIEVGGLSVHVDSYSNAFPIQTDDRSKAMLNGARISAENDASFTTDWHAADNNVYTLNAADVISMSNQELAFIDKCFATYKQVNDGIDDGSITTQAQVDAIFAQAFP